MNRTSFKSFTRAGMSMTTIAISIASVLSLTGCGSTGGSLSKAGDSGVASGTSHGAASGASSGTAVASSTTPTDTGTNTGTTGGSPQDAAKQSATDSWTNLVGGLGDVVDETGYTVTGLGTTLKVPSSVGGSPIGDNAVSSILTGTGGAIVGVGGGVTAGLDGVVDGENAVQVLALAGGQASGQVSIDVSDIGTAISATGTTLPNTLIVSPTLAALGSTVYSTGGSLSAIQFESAAILTDGTVQQVTAALKPLLYPLAIGAIEIASAVGTKTGLGGPLDTVFMQTGDGVALVGAQVASMSSSPVLQGLGGTVIATGDTVAAVGGVVHDGQSSSNTPITAISTTVLGTSQGLTGTLAGLPGGSALVSVLSGGKSVLAPALSGAVAGTGSAVSLGGSASQGPAPLTSALSGATNGAGTASLSPAPVPLLQPVITPVSALLSGAVTTLKGDSVLPSLPAVVARPAH